MRFLLNAKLIWKLTSFYVTQNKKKYEKCTKKELWNGIQIFLTINIPLRPEQVVLFVHRLSSIRNKKLFHLVAWNVFLIYFFFKKIVIWRKITLKWTKSCKLSCFHTKIQSSITLWKKRNSKKNLISMIKKSYEHEKKSY